MTRRRCVNLCIIIVLSLQMAGCDTICDIMGEKVQKYCGRDYGDRIHWTPVPKWFRPQDCKTENPDALDSDLYLGCFSAAKGFQQGEGGLASIETDRCLWKN